MDEAITAVSKPHSAEILLAEPAAVVGHYGNCLFTVTRQPFGHGWETTQRLAQRLVERYRGYAGLTIVEQGAGLLPDPETRERVARSAQQFSRHILASAMVFEGQGVWQRSMRLFGRAVILGMASRSPKRVFATTDDAIPWLFERVGPLGEFDVPGLLHAVGTARRT